MSYDQYFFTGITKNGDTFVAYWDGEFIGSYATRAEAKAAIKAATRR